MVVTITGLMLVAIDIGEATGIGNNTSRGTILEELHRLAVINVVISQALDYPQGAALSL